MVNRRLSLFLVLVMILAVAFMASHQALAEATTVAADVSAAKGEMAEFGALPTGGLIWDYGPTTGSQAGCWANTTSGQNFAEDVNFATNTSISSIVIYTCISPTPGTVHIKVRLDDGAGNPSNTPLYDADVTPTSWVADPVTGGYAVTADLPAPFAASAGTTYWIGLSGNGFELGQYSVQTPDDGMMAQFSGPTFSFHTSVGDQMFQLYGGTGGCPARFIDTMLTPNMAFDFSTGANSASLVILVITPTGTATVGPFTLPANYCTPITTGYVPTNPPVVAVGGILYGGGGATVVDFEPVP